MEWRAALTNTSDSSSWGTSTVPPTKHLMGRLLHKGDLRDAIKPDNPDLREATYHGATKGSSCIDHIVASNPHVGSWLQSSATTEPIDLDFSTPLVSATNTVGGYATRRDAGHSTQDMTHSCASP